MDNEEDNGTTTRIMDTNEDNTQGQKTMMRTTDNGQKGGRWTTTRTTHYNKEVG